MRGWSFLYSFWFPIADGRDSGKVAVEVTPDERAVRIGRWLGGACDQAYSEDLGHAAAQFNLALSEMSTGGRDQAAIEEVHEKPASAMAFILGGAGQALVDMAQVKRSAHAVRLNINRYSFIHAMCNFPNAEVVR